MKCLVGAVTACVEIEYSYTMTDLKVSL